MQPAPPTPKTGGEMLWEVTELLGGFAAMLLPLLLLAVPGIVLVVVPVALVLVVVAIPAALAATAVGLPYLLVRAVRR